MDGIVYAVMVGLGFALVENIIYVLGNPEQSFDIMIKNVYSHIFTSNLWCYSWLLHWSSKIF